MGKARGRYTGDAVSKIPGRKWKVWGEKQLARLKALPGLNVINRVYEPVKDIMVHIESVNGIDRVTVRVSGVEGGCKFPVVPICDDPCSNFQIQCEPPDLTPNEKRLGFLSRTPNDDDWSQYLWDFGEGDWSTWGNWATKHQVDNWYSNPGEYIVTLTVRKYESVSEYYITPTVVPGGTRYKSGVGSTQALAYAAFSAAPWVVTPGLEGAGAWYRVIGQKGFTPTPTFTYSAVRTTYQVDLSGVDPADVTFAQLNMDYGYDADYPPGTSPVHPGTEVDSSLGGSLNLLETEHQIDVMSLIGSSFQVEYRDEDEDYDPLPTIPTPLASASIIYARGWHGSTPDDIDFEYVPGGWTILKTTKTIKVNVGNPKRTKQVGESIHEDISP